MDVYLINPIIPSTQHVLNKGTETFGPKTLRLWNANTFRQTWIHDSAMQAGSFSDFFFRVILINANEMSKSYKPFCNALQFFCLK